METAARDGQAEVELGKLAVSKAQSSEVKNFAQTMVDDHSKANDQLQQIAKNKGVTLPSKPDSAHEQALKRLQNVSGAEFDKHYIQEAGLKDHRSAQKLFQDQAQKGQDPDLKAFAEKTLPVITHHAEMAKNMAEANKKK